MKVFLELPSISHAVAQENSSMDKSKFTSKRTMCMIILKSNNCRFWWVYQLTQESADDEENADGAGDDVRG